MLPIIIPLVTPEGSFGLVVGVPGDAVHDELPGITV